MNKPIQRLPETQEIRREIPFRSALENETNISLRDPDTMLGMTMLLLACLALAVLAHAVI